MFVRYFGHGAVLNERRKQIPDSELHAIGLYLRPDTRFCRLMTEEWLGKEEAKLAFSHYVALSLLRDACSAIDSINKANFASGPLSIGNPVLGVALAMQLGMPGTRLAEITAALDARFVELELWVNSPRKCPVPQFIAFASVMSRFATDLASVTPRLANVGFRAFIDEFENLTSAHREVVCDAIKHPSGRLVVHIAHKQHAIRDFKTSSDERVVEIHDYITIDLEKELSEDHEFKLVAAELILLRADQAGLRVTCPLFKPELLHDLAHLPYRLSAPYREAILGAVKAMLPGPSASQIARQVVNDEPLRRRLRETLQRGLEYKKLTGDADADTLIHPTYPEASIVLGALLNRRSQDGATLLRQFHQAVSAGPSDTDPFFKVGGWIDNNLHGCLFYLYAGLPRRPNINYAGFDRFCLMAKPNLRFFQAICHATLSLAANKPEVENVEDLVIDADVQAVAARQVSDKLFQSILQLGHHGAHLLEITGRLGRIFEAFNRRRSQSEPEINHISIDNADRDHLSERAELLLREAKIWSVVYEEQDTKNKSDYDIAHTDLILNPIYAPHFSISYRKRRKITIKAAIANVLLCESTAQYNAVLKQLVEPGESNGFESGSLF